MDPKKVDAMFAREAKKLKPNPSQAAIDRAVARLMSDLDKAKRANSTRQKISVLMRLGKFAKRAAYWSALTAAFVNVLYTSGNQWGEAMRLGSRGINKSLRGANTLADVFHLQRVSGLLQFVIATIMASAWGTLFMKTLQHGHPIAMNRGIKQLKIRARLAGGYKPAEFAKHY